MSVAFQADCQNIAADLRALCERIGDQFGPAESAFLDVGTTLQALCIEVESLSSKAGEAANEITSSLKLNALPELSRVSQTLLNELAKGSSCIQESLGAFDRIAAALGELHEATDFLKTAAKRLNAIRVYIEIESSRSEETQAAFASFSGDLKKLTDFVTETCSALVKDDRIACQKGEHAHSEIADGLRDISKLSVFAANTVQQTHDNVNLLLTKTAESLVEVSTHSMAIGKVVDEVIQSLQFQDIVRQQLEHVVASINEASSIVDELAGSREPDLSRAAAILKLQEEHMREAHRAIKTVHDRIIAEFGKAHREVGKLIVALPQAALDESSERGRDSLDEILENVEKQISLYDRTTFLETRTETISNTASCHTKRLEVHVDRIRRVSEDMVLGALNATVTSARLGKAGTTLKVLSEEVTKLSTAFTAFVTKTATILGEIQDAASVMSESVKRNLSTVGEMTGLKDLLQTMRSASKGLDEACESITKQGKQLQSRIMSCEVDFEFLDIYAEHLLGEAEKIGRLRASIAPYVSDPCMALQDNDDLLNTRYTMEKERDVYRRVTYGTDVQESPDDATTVEGGCLFF
jgi:methyl-accepting chemotaxis protein